MALTNFGRIRGGVSTYCLSTKLPPESFCWEVGSSQETWILVWEPEGSGRSGRVGNWGSVALCSGVEVQQSVGLGGLMVLRNLGSKESRRI